MRYGLSLALTVALGVAGATVAQTPPPSRPPGPRSAAMPAAADESSPTVLELPVSRTRDPHAPAEPNGDPYGPLSSVSSSYGPPRALAAQGKPAAPEPIPAPRPAPVPSGSPAMPPPILSPDSYGPPAGVVLPAAGAPGERDPGLEDGAWASAEYLMWFFSRYTPPPLVQFIPPFLAGTANLPPGAATNLFGGRPINSNPYSGARFTIGAWFDDCETIGFDASYFFTEQRSVSFNADSPGYPLVIGQSFYNVNMNNGQFTFFFGDIPNRNQSERIGVGITSDLEGGEVNARIRGLAVLADRADLLVGVRYLRLRESLASIADTTFTGANPGVITLFDSFATRNEFYGGQVGLHTKYNAGHLSLELIGKLALGGMHQSVQVNGNTVFAPVGGPTTVQLGGLYALPTNIGNYGRDKTVFIPDLTLKIGYKVTSHVTAFLGYNLLIVSSVERPGKAIDQFINVSQIPVGISPPSPPSPIIRPTFRFDSDNFYAQGINFGVQLSY